MSAGCRALLLAGVQEAVRRLKFRMCVIWLPTVCSYVENDSIDDGIEPPSGGFTLPKSINIYTRKTIENKEVLVEHTVTVIH